MPAIGCSRRFPVRDVLTIGQVWRHHDPDFSIEVKQVHRADRLLEAWMPSVDGPQARTVTFNELQREYELIG